MPQTEVDETQVNELDENPLEDLFNRPSDSPGMDMLGGSGTLILKIVHKDKNGMRIHKNVLL